MNYLKYAIILPHFLLIFFCIPVFGFSPIVAKNYQIGFEQNVGQFGSNEVKYVLRGNKGDVFFYQNKVTFILHQSSTLITDSIHALTGEMQEIFAEIAYEMSFDNALNSAPFGAEEMSLSFNFFSQQSVKGTTIHRYNKIVYRNAFKAIDLVFYIDQTTQSLKYDLLVKPGGELTDIQIAYQGVDNLKIDNQGQLVIKTKDHSFFESKPISGFIQSESIPNILYVVYNNILSFRSKQDLTALSHDTLIIDPAMLTWSSFLYGTTKIQLPSSSHLINESVSGIDTDHEGNLYVLGSTNQHYTQATRYFDSAYNKDYLAHTDIYFIKLNADGDSIIFFNFIGSRKNDWGISLSIEPDGSSLILGRTALGSEFPTTEGAFNRSSGGTVLFGFDPNGDSILFSTYVAFTGLFPITAQFLRNKDIVLYATVGQAKVPITSNAVQPNFGGGNYDAYIAIFSADAKQLLYATYHGGSNDEWATDAIVSNDDRLFVIGKTRSSDFPVNTTNSSFRSHKGGYDGFVSKLDSSLTKWEFSSLIGGYSNDQFVSIALNEQGDIFLSGLSTSTDFPLSIYPKAFQQRNNGGYDIVVTRLFPDGNNIRNSTYLGGSKDEFQSTQDENQTQIGLNAKGEVWVTGVSKSVDFPISSDAFQKKNDTLGIWKTDITLTKLSPELDKIIYSTYFGGNLGEMSNTNSVKRTGCITNIFIGGYTNSANLATTSIALMPKPPKDTVFGSLVHADQYPMGFMARFTDTLHIDIPNFGTKNKLKCNNFLEILDAGNAGAHRRWSTNDSGRYLLVNKPGTYWLQATYGCDTLRDTITILQQFGPKSVLPKDTFICDKNPILLRAENDSINARFLWNTLDTSSRITINKSGTYWVKITTVNCGEITDTIHVHYINAPILQLPKDTSICNQDSIVLRVNQNNFEKTTWIDSIQSPHWVVRQAGLYNVKTSNVCGVDSANIQVDFAKSPKPFNIFKDTTICQGAEFVVKTGTLNNLETYLWVNTTTQKTVSLADTFFVNQSGKFVVYNSNVCGSTADSFNVTHLTLPLVGLDSLYNPCQGYALSLKAGKSENQEKYIWSNTATTAHTTYNQSGNHWVQISNKCGTVFQKFNISFATKPKALFDNPDVCEGQNIQFQPLNNGGQSFLWRLGDGNISIDSAPVHQYPRTRQARTYLVSLKVSTSKDCSDSITLPVNVLVSPEASFTHNSSGKTVFFTPNETPSGASYRWTFGDGDSSKLRSPSHTYQADSGTYTVCLSVTNAEGCLQNSCKQVYFNIGIHDMDKDITIYPNPTENLLYITSVEPLQNSQFTLSDAQGKTILQSTCNGLSCTLNLKSLPKGVYSLSIENEGKVMKKAVVKM